MKAFLLSTLLENVINSMLMPVQLKRNNTGPGDCCGVQHRVGPFGRNAAIRFRQREPAFSARPSTPDSGVASLACNFLCNRELAAVGRRRKLFGIDVAYSKLQAGGVCI
jgi:hypothetical protein